MKTKTLERITTDDIIDYILLFVKDHKVKFNDYEQMLSGIEQILQEYSENWASENAHNWLIEHHP